MAEKKNREDAHVSLEGWSGWKRAMVPDEGRARTARDNGNVGYYCDNIKDAFNDKDCGLYEWKAVHRLKKSCSRAKAKNCVVYIGRAHRETPKDLERRIMEYCRSGGHKKRVINKVLRYGYELHVRVKPIDDDNKDASRNAENAMLKKYNYAWNKRRNKPYRGNKVPQCPPCVYIRNKS